MSVHVDGFVVPVPKNKRAAYRRMVRMYSAWWIQHGALDVHECAGDDVKPGKRMFWGGFNEIVSL